MSSDRKAGTTSQSGLNASKGVWILHVFTGVPGSILNRLVTRPDSVFLFSLCSEQLPGSFSERCQGLLDFLKMFLHYL